VLPASVSSADTGIHSIKSLKYEDFPFMNWELITSTAQHGGAAEEAGDNRGPDAAVLQPDAADLGTMRVLRKDKERSAQEVRQPKTTLEELRASWKSCQCHIHMLGQRRQNSGWRRPSN
jgi:hypothetical protein